MQSFFSILQLFCLIPDLANLISLGVEYVNQTGVVITNITCDNATSNITALTLLGAKLSRYEDLKVTIDIQNTMNIPIFVIMDACHLVKLVRGTFHDFKVLYTEDGDQIRWNYLQSLLQLQMTEGLHLANKLRKDHIEYENMKMKVYLCTQLLSESVASALQFCEESLKHPDFSNTAATSNFLRKFNNVFDVLNSKSPLGKYSKAPIGQSNEKYWMKIIDETRDYIPTLHETDPVDAVPSTSKRARSGNIRIMEGRRKKGFLGFLVDLKSVENIFKCYVKTGHLKYILTYKLSQDHLELFFNSIRSSLGANTNPTVLQFYSAYRKIMIGATSNSFFGNCLMQDDTEVMILPPKIPVTEILEEDEEDDISDVIKDSLETKSEYRQNVLVYIAGYIQRRVSKTMQCTSCQLLLSNMRISVSSGLIETKDRGGLIRPSADIVRLINIVDSIFNQYLVDGKLFTQKRLIEKIFIQTLKVVNSCNLKLFDFLDDHVENIVFGSHRSNFFKKVVFAFVTMRARHSCREFNNSCAKVRIKLSKLILFKNQ